MHNVASSQHFRNQKYHSSGTPTSTLSDDGRLVLRGLRISKLYAPQNIPERPTTNTGRHRHVPSR